MRIAKSPDFLQSIMQDDRVSRWIRRDGDPDVRLADVWSELLGLEFETGGFLFHDLGDGVAEVHTLFLPKSTDVPRCAEQALAFVFGWTSVIRVITKVPEINRAARALATGAGFRHDYTLPGAWLSRGKRCDVAVLSLDLDLWARRHGYNVALSPEKSARARRRWAVTNIEPMQSEETCPQHS